MKIAAMQSHRPVSIYFEPFSVASASARMLDIAEVHGSINGLTRIVPMGAVYATRVAPSLNATSWHIQNQGLNWRAS
jgi:hypothetical protein